MKLTENQRRAIRHSGSNLQLIACAGSGKTEVVARHVVHLLATGEVNPRNIIAFTFTEKAAAELKQRILERSREQLGDITGMAELFVGTIHAFCLDLLKSEVPQYLKYDVLNEVQQALFVDRHSSQSGLTRATKLDGQLLRRYVDTKNYIEALEILREERLVPSALAGVTVASAMMDYVDLMHAKAHLDYSGIMHAAVQAVELNQGVRDRLAPRVRHVVVDEYQDVNPIQERLIEALHSIGARVVVVGDDDQTVYQWRGGDVKNILSFANRYQPVDTIPLQENYRSSRGVIETAHEFIEQNAVRLPKEMEPTGAQPDEDGDIVAVAFESPDAEAEYIASSISQLRGVAFKSDSSERGLAFSDMAILLRSVKGNAEPITKALDRAGIKYIVGGMSTLFDTKEAQAARALFYFLASRDDVGRAELTRAWVQADLGLDPACLAVAVEQAASARSAFTDDDASKFRLYGLQRQFLSFLEAIQIREWAVPRDRGEVVLYNLGKFSQVISDFESIHWSSRPDAKYDEFARFLEYRAADIYPEGWQDNQYANPDAVRIMTVHQAKGLEWPVVFVPALCRNRFPAAAVGGVSVWHLIPRTAVVDQSRYEGTIEDERRLFYVAMTRSQKFLSLTWAPVPGKNNRYARVSEFWQDALRSKWVKRRQFDYSGRQHMEPQPKAAIANVVFSFSELKYFLECPYQFKLRVLYGFNAPIHEALGYGKSLHDALADINKRALREDYATYGEARSLIETHLNLPFAYPKLREQLLSSGQRIVADYIRDNEGHFATFEYSEKDVELDLGDGVSVTGRIDLVRRLDTDETYVVDFKTRERVQAEEVTEDQLSVYALGYERLTGRRPDFVEVYDLDERRRVPRSVDDVLLSNTKDKVVRAAADLRAARLPTMPAAKKCGTCDFRRMCGDSAAS